VKCGTVGSSEPHSTVELIVELRRELTGQGLDAGADTIGWHLEHRHQLTVSRATIDRTLRRRGLVTPSPHKRPRSSYIRFQAELPNELWQADFTHYPLTTGVDGEVLSWLDDHARHTLSVTAHRRVTGPIVVDSRADRGDETPVDGLLVVALGARHRGYRAMMPLAGRHASAVRLPSRL
jgi:hypothetical protein